MEEESLVAVRRQAKEEVEILEARMAEDRRRAEATRAQEREGFEAQLAQAREQAKQDAREREQEWKSREAILTAKVAALQEALSRTQVALEQQVLKRLDEERVRASPSSSSSRQ